MPDETSPNGFSVENGAYFAAGNGAGTSRADYDSWGWKEIKAAIVGSAAVGNDQRGDAEQRNPGVSDPRSLWQAALDFRMAKEVLAMVGKSIHDQAEALAGEHGPWQGEAATAFKNMMEPFSKAFLNHAEQIDGGPARLNPVPEQLWAAGNYLDYARREVSAIDSHYAAEARRIAVAYTQTVPGLFSPIEFEMPNGLTYVSWNEQIVQMMTADMRRVLKTLASQYEDVRFQTEVQPVPVPNPLGGGPNPNDFNPDDIKYDPNDFDFTPKDFNPNEFNPQDFNPQDFTTQGPPPSPNAFNSEGFDPNAFNPGAFDPGAFNPSTFNPGAFDPGAFDPNAFQSNPFTPNQFDPQGFNPGGLNPSDFSPNPFDPNSPGASSPNLPGGSEFTPPAVQPFQPGGGVVPPVLPFPGGTGSTGGTSSIGGTNRNGLGNVPPPQRFTGGAGGGGGTEMPQLTPPDFKGVEPPAMPEMPGIEEWTAGKGPGQLNMPDQRGVGMPPMMPFAPGAGGAGTGAPERSDASGLLGGEVKPWESSEFPGLGDPQSLTDLPSDTPEKWAAGGGVGTPQMPMMPMAPMAPMAPGAGGTNSGAERSDASGLLGGEVEPWEGAEIPGLGDPVATTDAPANSPEEWATTSGIGSQQLPMMPMAPMAPVAPGAGANSGTERSDASGLLGGESKSWEPTELAGLGDPQGTDAPAVDPQEWAAADDGVAAQQVPVMPMAPMAPSPTTTNSSAERSDASGLLSGEAEPWQSVERPEVGEPQSVEAPAVAPQEWAVAGADAQAPQEPAVEEDEDRIAVVAPADTDEDTSAWDVAAAGSLLWLTAAASRAEAEPEPEIAPDYTLRETAPWGHTSSSSARTATEPTGRMPDASDYLPRPFDPNELPGCGGPDEAPEEPEAEIPGEDEAEEEEKERTSADLLKQDEDAWSTPAPKAPGVIE